MGGRTKPALLAAILALSAAPGARGATLLEKDGWKFTLGGFAEIDGISDTTSGFTEVAGNGPVERPGTVAGERGRGRFSVRNSRLAFVVQAPPYHEWIASGTIETDLLGYDPAPGSAAGNSEAGFYTNPTLRLRHAYGQLTTESVQVLFGQTWTLFGWQPAYQPTSVSVPPVAGINYERTPQVLFVGTSRIFDSVNTFQLGAAVRRPLQRDAGLPAFDAGIKLALNDIRAPYTSPSGSASDTQPLSVGLSGTYRRYQAPGTLGGADEAFDAKACAIGAFVPLVPSLTKDDHSSTLGISGELSVGEGYGDEFPGWTGNLPQFTASATNPLTLDAGIGGYDPAGAFHLVRLESWNIAAQYHFSDGKTFMNVGYGRLGSTNAAALTPATGKFTYTLVEAHYVNLFTDVTTQIRVGLEYAGFRTTYGDGLVRNNMRLAASGWFRF